MNSPTEANAPQNLAEAIGLVRQKQFPFSPLPRIFKYLFLFIKQEYVRKCPSPERLLYQLLTAKERTSTTVQGHSLI